MKKIVLIIFIVAFSGYAQVHNLKKGFVAEGYDVVAYFDNKAEEGSKKFVLEHEGLKLKFTSAKNLETFKKDPEKYLPQYGGYCAYAIGKSGKKVGINPKTFEVRDNKLYLFYNAWGTNTLKSWKSEGAEDLKKKADENWNASNKK
jgi:YHS domain-containing protein